MRMICSIVVATDSSRGSDAAVELAVQLAQAHGASLRLLHTFNVSMWHSVTGVFDAQRLSIDPLVEAHVQQRLTDAAASLAVPTGLKIEA